MKNSGIKFIVETSLIAASYVILTLISYAFGLSNGVFQIRISEALTVLPCFFYSAIPGLFIGCIIANFITGCVIYDVIFCSLATLVAAYLTYLLRKNKYVAVLPPIILNALVVPYVIKYVYGINEVYIYLVVSIGFGEIIACGILGIILYNSIEKKINILKESHS